MWLSRKVPKQGVFTKGMPEVKTADVDRLIALDPDKFRICCTIIWGNNNPSFEAKPLTEIEDFLSLYFGCEAVIYGMIMNRDSLTAMPYWTIYYSER